MAFNSNVFINCPFDDQYVPLLRALVFTVLYLDLTPHLSQTVSSSNIGALEYGGGRLKTRKILILETERYHYQKVLSDISGQDISSHEDNPKTLVRRVRDWLSNNSDKTINPYSEIWTALNQFTDDLSRSLGEKFTAEEIREMPIGDYIKFARDWIAKFKK